MGAEQGPADREQAVARFEQAQHELARGHQQRAEEMAKEALEFDAGFNPVRLWLAAHYVAQDDAHHASRVLQDAIFTDRGDQEAWARLREVDAATASRLERLGEIAPDPFVTVHRNSALDDDLDSIEGLAPVNHDADWLYEEVPPDDLFETDDDEECSFEEEEAGEVDTRGPAPWEYDQDRAYLARWQQEAIVQTMVATLQEAWTREDALLPVLEMCAHLEAHRHPEIVEWAHRCAHLLGLADAELMVFAEPCLTPVPIADNPPRLAIPTGLIRSLHGPQVGFHLGRDLEYIRSGYLAEWLIADLVADRRTRLAGDVASTLRELIHQMMVALEMDIHRDQRQTLAKLAHAWQQRATLSADRAGYLCCGDLDAACTAIAKACTPSFDKAAAVTLSGFLEQFQGRDAAALAAIPPQETPDRSVDYGAYRIKMLRWWSTTPEAAGLLEAFTVA
ncbi:MAG TPA: hypothetical protein VGM19_04000 [Armatimonadota bacterium]|jgi:hypothetical protein